MREQVEKTIEVIRPALQADGGDITLHDVDEATGIVKVELTGACVGCPASTQTLKAGIERIMRGGDAAREVGRLAAPRAGHAYTIGLTGAPGAGKSTLTSALVSHLRSLGDEVAVLAVDPSSPFTGGAILGDRVRMQDHATDPGVFIRS